MILGFHVDNGSEYINHRVAKMLEKLYAEFTKRRACRSQDNALLERKNGAVIRKLIGYGDIAGEHAERIGKFDAQHLNPYLNFQRPCGFSTVTLDEDGKRRRQYNTEDYRTPFQKLKSLERVEQRLKPGKSSCQAGQEPCGAAGCGSGSSNRENGSGSPDDNSPIRCHNKAACYNTTIQIPFQLLFCVEEGGTPRSGTVPMF